MILDLIEKNRKITQRAISETLYIAVSMVNTYLSEFESRGLIKRKYISTKNVDYFITDKGIERRKVLNISYFSASLSVFKSAKENISEFLNEISDKGFKNIFLYGAGEVAEIILQSISMDSNLSLKVIAVIDDDLAKQQYDLLNYKIISFSSATEIEHDGILIASYSNKDLILEKLNISKYKKEKILQFFN